MEENQKTEKSKFFETVDNAIRDAMQLKTKADSILMMMTDGTSAIRLVGGNSDIILSSLLSFMKDNPSVAEIICRASLEYHVQLMQQRVLRIEPPQVPEDGVALWPDGRIIFTEKCKDAPNYLIGVDMDKDKHN